MGKWARVDFNLCDPNSCDAAAGGCAASERCTHKLLEQEEPYEVPMLLSKRLCVGCGSCAKNCSCSAIVITIG